ncbi:nuclear transport factor 2 family protein [Telluria beijingensis]|uniref:nuclear transport factor 2 family protein n=1 Tax=Telluria beijingensis TaxID=3068633 RepID=UPI00279604FD|nr:nuclear transport factor 2 family protein [Massilia sp. REN29]
MSHDLEQRLARLEAAEAIRQLKARYARLADAKYGSDYRRQPAPVMLEIARAQADCFAEDARWDGGPGFGASLVGRAALADWFARSPWCWALHYYTSPEIAVEGERAHASWRLWQIALRDPGGQALLLAAVTHEDYARQPDGNWLCTQMRFEQTQMLPVGAGSFPLATSFEQIPSAGSGAEQPFIPPVTPR